MKGKITYLLGILLAIQTVLGLPVMLATNITYPDMLVASAAASKIGAEVLWTGKDSIPSDIFSAINETQPEEIYIIGGPAVVSENIENELSQYYNVTRIWGMTRYGTSAEVARYFWSDGTQEAVIVPNDINDDNGELVAKAKDLAASEGIPLLIIPPGTIPSEIESVLSDLGVKKVYIVGTVTQNVKDKLESMGIEYETYGEKEIEEKVMKKTGKVLIVATRNWKGLLYSPGFSKGVVIFVNSEDQISEVIQKLEDKNKEINLSIKVTGIPELATKICEELNKTDLNFRCITGKREKVVRKIAKEERERIREIREKYKERLEEIREKLKEKLDKIKERCEEDYKIAQATYEQLNTTGDLTTVDESRYQLIQSLRDECIKAVNDQKPLYAMKMYNQLSHEVKLFVWNKKDELPEDLQTEIEEEIKSDREIKERVEKVKERIRLIKEKLRETSPECEKELKLVEKYLSENKIREAYRESIVARKICEKAKEAKIVSIIKEKTRKYCPQVIVYAVNPETGECKEFANPCRVPEKWKIVRNCEVAEKIKKVRERYEEKSEECKELAVELRKAKISGNEEEYKEILNRFRENCRIRVIPNRIIPKPITNVTKISGSVANEIQISR